MESSEGGLPPQRSLKEKVNNLWGKWRKPSTALELSEAISSSVTAVEQANIESLPPLVTAQEEITQDSAKHTFVGLERLDGILKDEQFLEGALEMVPADRKEKISIRLANLREEREKLYERYGVRELIETDSKEQLKKYGQALEVKNAKGISKLLINHLANQLPPVREGSIRMYRGEGPHPGTTEDPQIGRWFGHDLVIASSYPAQPLGTSHIVYVDIPKTSLAQYHVNDMANFKGASKAGEYLLPLEVVKQAREFIRFLKADEEGDPWRTIPS